MGTTGPADWRFRLDRGLAGASPCSPNGVRTRVSTVLKVLLKVKPGMGEGDDWVEWRLRLRPGKFRTSPRALGDEASLSRVGFESPVQREPMPFGEVLKQWEQLVLRHRREHERERGMC
jgi:hypothetical protein